VSEPNESKNGKSFFFHRRDLLLGAFDSLLRCGLAHPAVKRFNKSMQRDTTSFISTPHMRNFHALIAIQADLRNNGIS